MFAMLKALFGGKPQAAPSRPAPDPDRIRRLSSDGEFGVKVAGTSHFQDAIARSEKRRRSDHSGDFLASLVPDPENPHDANAIRVMQKGELLGYIPGDLTAEIHGALAEAALHGQECKAMARVIGHGKKAAGLRLNIARPARLA